MRKKEIYKRLVEYFQHTMPEANTELKYDNPFQLLCAVILSAQCTEAMACSTKEEILEYVKSVSYPNSKAEHLVEMARQLMQKHRGEVPGNFDELVALPGVGRKTANVMLSVAFNEARMAVDTHVFRVSHRIGLVSDKCTTPYAVEKELVKNIPQELIPRAHHWLILHGRYVCKSQRPQCEQCGLADFCSYNAKRK